jgi:hypothetical protein
MEWGKRKYQTKNGTWTEEGLRRRRMMESDGGSSRKQKKEEAKAQKAAAKAERREQKMAAKAEKHEKDKQEALASGDAKKIAKFRNELTDDEVNEAISRINMQTRFAQAKEAQDRVGSDKVKRITGTAKDTLNNVVDIYDTTAAIANATGLLKKELPVLFKDQKRKGVTLSDRGLAARVQNGTATQDEVNQFMANQHGQLTTGSMSNADRARYQNILERRSEHGAATDQDRADMNRLQEDSRNRQRSILTPTARQYSAEEDQARQRVYNTTHQNHDQLRMMANAAAEVYGASDPRTIQLRNAQTAMAGAARVAEVRAGAYSQGNPDMRQHFTSRYNRQIDRSIRSDAVNRRAVTAEQRRARDQELQRRTRETDEAFTAIRGIDMDNLRNTYGDLLNIGYDGRGMSMDQRNAINELRERERNRIGHI